MYATLAAVLIWLHVPQWPGSSRCPAACVLLLRTLPRLTDPD